MSQDSNSQTSSSDFDSLLDGGEDQNMMMAQDKDDVDKDSDLELSKNPLKFDDKDGPAVMEEDVMTSDDDDDDKYDKKARGQFIRWRRRRRRRQTPSPPTPTPPPVVHKCAYNCTYVLQCQGSGSSCLRRNSVCTPVTCKLITHYYSG